MQEMFGAFADAINTVTVRLANADFLTLALICGAIGLVVYFLFKS
jgi:hypothetical protein